MSLPVRILLVCLVVIATPGRVHAQNGNGGTGGNAVLGTPPARTRIPEADYEAERLKRVITAVRIAEKITLDGRLDEPAWKLAVPITDFIQRIPRTGELSEERTEVRVLYDGDNLYVGVSAFDSRPALVVRELKKDFEINGTDLIQVIIDSLHDGRTGFSLSTNPAGAKRDNQLSAINSAGGGVDWDGVWDVKTRRLDEGGWVAEYEVPFKTMRFSSAPSQVWGLQIARRIPRLNEESEWTPVPFRGSSVRTQYAGTLRGLENISPGRNLKLKPYVLGQASRARIGGQLTKIDSLLRIKDYNAGFDLKYSLTPSLTLDTTYRTDFAQVEADQQQVNLTRFNLFFPEKREFFLENAGTFAFGPGGNLVPFFSRRIGLSAAGTPVPIIGGGRVSGQLGSYNVGFLAMKTEDVNATPLGNAMPSNNYVVGRVQRNVFRNSWIGAIGTHRDSSVAGDYNRVYGPDAHFQFYDKLVFDSYLLRSDTPGKSGKNQARRFQAGWKDDELSISGEYNAVQPNFNPEVGFVRRGNVSQYNGDFAWKPRITHKTIQNLNFASGLDYYKGASSGQIETRVQDATVGLQYHNMGSTNFNINRTFDRLTKPFAIRTDILIPAGDYEYRFYTASANAGNNGKITGSGNVSWGEFWNGHTKSVSGTMGLRPHYHFSVDLNYSRNHVTLPNGGFTTNLIGSRFLYSFTSRAFLNAFFQYNADTRQVSSNIRFNLIHHPLSDLYLVYNDTHETTTGETVGRAFMIKLTNLFNF
ncbi:MAG TPA: DUF5916 domain-containing protein [Vicinamibacterales bacterium]